MHASHGTVYCAVMGCCHCWRCARALKSKEAGHTRTLCAPRMHKDVSHTGCASAAQSSAGARTIEHSLDTAPASHAHRWTRGCGAYSPPRPPPRTTTSRAGCAYSPSPPPVRPGRTPWSRWPPRTPPRPCPSAGPAHVRPSKTRRSGERATQQDCHASARRRLHIVLTPLSSNAAALSPCSCSSLECQVEPWPRETPVSSVATGPMVDLLSSRRAGNWKPALSAPPSVFILIHSTITRAVYVQPRWRCGLRHTQLSSVNAPS